MLTVKLVKSQKKGKAVIAFCNGKEYCYWPPFASNKPDYRNKYVTINCVKYLIEWVK